MRPLYLLLPLTLVTTVPALADAVTYKGTIGKTAIVVEFSAPPESATGAFAGRYFYPNKGIDIPLDPLRVNGGKLRLVEEEPCTSACQMADDGTVSGFKQGATWDLVSGRDNTLTGKWTLHGRSQPITLSYVGSRPFTPDGDVTPMALAAQSEDFVVGSAAISLSTTPYDALRMDVPLKDSTTTDFDGSTLRYVIDPRTKFAFPRIVQLADGSSPDAANATLTQRHWAMNDDALYCESLQYAGLGWFDATADQTGSLGGYPDETVDVTYLSPTLISWTESGSLYCGGAHPDNHITPHNLDVKTGEPLDLSRILKDWVPHNLDGSTITPEQARANPDEAVWGPDADLIAFVTAHLNPADPEFPDAECGLNDLIANNLGVRVDKGGVLVFTLVDLPSVIAACTADLYAAPIATLRPLLADSAATYFPELAD